MKLFSQQAVEAYRVVMLGMQHCLDSRLADGGEAASLTHRPVPVRGALAQISTEFFWSPCNSHSTDISTVIIIIIIIIIRHQSYGAVQQTMR
jgi:hypothetical protein